MNTNVIQTLLIEDNPGDARLLREYLSDVPSPMFDVTQVDTLAAGIHRLEEIIVDIVLLDLGLPDSQGFDSFERLRIRAPNIPIVVLTGLDDDLLAVRAVTEGAQDYLVKGNIDSRMLVRTLWHALERHRLHRQLGASEARFRSIIEHSADGMLIVDQGDIIRFANPAAEVLFARPAGELVGESFGLPLAGDEVSGVDLQNEVGVVTRVDLRATPIDWEGSPAYLVSLRDVTEQRKAAERIEFQADILRNVRDSVIVTDLDGKVIYWNEGAQQIFGYTAQEMLGRTLQVTYPDQDPEQFADDLADIVAGHEYVGEWRGRTKEGQEVWVDIKITLLSDGTGTVSGFIGVAKDITWRKQAEAELQTSETRYRGLFEGVPVGLLRVTPGGSVLSANRAAVRILGYPDRETLLAANVEDLFVDPQARDRELVPLAGEQEVVSFQVHARRHDGQIIWLRDVVRAVKDETGAIRHYESSVEDVTPSVRAQEEARRYTERLRALHAIDGAILAAWTPEATAQASLRHLRRLIPGLHGVVQVLDRARSEGSFLAVAADIPLQIPPGTRFRFPEGADFTSMEQGKVIIEPDILAPGAMRQHAGIIPPRVVKALAAAGVRTFIAVPLIAQGHLIGTLGLVSEDPLENPREDLDVIREVADQLAVALHQARLRSALEAERQRLEALVEHLPDGILLLDDRMRIVLMNPAAQEQLPALADATLGDVLHHLAGQPIAELLAPPPPGLRHQLTVNGHTAREFEVVARPIDHAEGAASAPRGWAVLIQDVTRERELQSRIQQQDRLATVGQLAAGIAHDFNNIMGSIVLYASILLRLDDLQPKIRENLTVIHDQGHRAADLIRQILDFSRQSVMERQPVNLVPFLKEFIKLLQRTLPENIHINLAHDSHIAMISADPTRIQQVAMNLSINARDAMPRGGRLDFRLEHLRVEPGATAPLPEMNAGAWIRISVTDTGSGISSEVFPHIFEPFFTTKRPGQGTGLGLPQVYGIVQQHEGHIDVHTSPGKGTSFILYLPELQTPYAERALQEAEAPLSSKGESILIVEDDVNVLQAMAEVLELLGYRVLKAPNGLEALAIYRQMGTEIDLILTDAIMPDIHGVELVGRIRALHPDAKAVLVTGYTLNDDLRQARESGILDILSKPLDMETLGRAVRRALDSH